MSENYTVYCHICPNGKRYVGMTGRPVESRWQNGRGYSCNKYFSKAIDKYGWKNIEHQILATGISFDEACALEREYIGLFKSNDAKHGYNLDSGGNSQKKHSEETKKKIGDSHRGIKINPDAIKRMSAVRKQSDKVKARCRLNNEPKKVPVAQYDIQGNKVTTYESLRAAQRATGIDRKCISDCISGICHVAGGYQWTLNLECEKIQPFHKYNGEVTVSQLTLDGEHIGTYPSIKEAALKVGTNPKNISACINGHQKTAAGFKWKKDSGGYREKNNQ